MEKEKVIVDISSEEIEQALEYFLAAKDSDNDYWDDLEKVKEGYNSKDNRAGKLAELVFVIACEIAGVPVKISSAFKDCTEGWDFDLYGKRVDASIDWDHSASVIYFKRNVLFVPFSYYDEEENVWHNFAEEVFNEKTFDLTKYWKRVISTNRKFYNALWEYYSSIPTEEVGNMLNLIDLLEEHLKKRGLI